jgi:hypothetical protein
MKKHIVTCVKCGRQFDANEGGAYYPESRRYVCKRCVDKQKSEQADREKARKAEERKAEADERERVTGMRQSKAAMLVKIVVGCFYFCWYSVLACGWMLYGLFYGLYLMFKYAAIGTKKLYTCIKGKITHIKH